MKRFAVMKEGALPGSVDLRGKFPPVFDQGDLGSCTAQALVGVYSYDAQTVPFSRLFLYYNERKIDGDVGEDAGSTISSGISALEQYGVCVESLSALRRDKVENSTPSTLLHRRASARRNFRGTSVPDDLCDARVSGGRGTHRAGDSCLRDLRDTRNGRDWYRRYAWIQRTMFGRPTRSMLWVTTTLKSGSSCATRGGRGG